MTVDALLHQIGQLPLTRRLALIEQIAKSVREELATTLVAPTLTKGMLRAESELPTEQELKDAYINYLDDKYR
jgi:hypothetical protein